MACEEIETTWDRWELLVCPTCHSRLRCGEDELYCPTCDVAYAITEGVPRMIDWAGLPAAVQQEMVGQDEHFAGLPDKAVFKPDLHPRYRRRRMQVRLAHLLAALQDDPRPASATQLSARKSVHVACCGTGYEVEALLGAGYDVSASDLSAQALRGLAKRATARGYRVPYVQADVLHLPFATDSFDLVVVVEGLHHTPDVPAGFAELVRVARHRVALIEPYTGVAFNLLARVGLAHRDEYSRTQPGRLSASWLGQVMSSERLAARAWRLYLDLPPGLVTDRLGEFRLAGALLSAVTLGLEGVLRLFGVGNKALLSVDLV